MWSNWAEQAKSSVTQALDKTGDILSKAATNAGKSAREKGASVEQDEGNPKQTQQNNNNNSNEPTIVQLPPDPKKSVPEVTANVVQQQQPQKEPSSLSESSHEQRQQSSNNENKLFSNISQGWFNVIDATVATLKHAEGAISEQRMMFEQNITKAISNNNYHKRDISLPLDVEALQDAEVVYITDRIITMGHPTMDSNVNPDITGRRKVVAIAHLLERRHASHYMVWNLSELDYDLEIFNDQVLTYSFPGSPSPPLGLLLKLFISMESWLKADVQNVAVVHCLTGKGRTSTVLAAFLCWMGEAQFNDIYQALEYIATCKQVTLDDLTIPSQRRYASYFKNMLDGVRPSQPPLMLKRIIMSEAPNFANGPPRGANPSGHNDNNPTTTTTTLGEDDSRLHGCLPYVQIFKAGSLLYTAAASLHFQQAENEVPFCYVADGNVSFHINLMIQGDILVRARHLTPTMKRISMFRAAFHTGYAPPNVMRFTKLQLDGACNDDRFKSDFFIDFIFEPIDAEEASKLLSTANRRNDETNEMTPPNPEATNVKKANVRKAVQASAEDSMLYGDSRFWDVISNRMKENATQTTAANSDPLFGPTVGRRRDQKHSADDQNNEMKLIDPVSTSKASSMSASEDNRRNPNNSLLGAFSIGGEMDFLPAVVGSESSQMQTIDSPPQKSKKSISSVTQQPKKDSLLEALMGALDDNHDENDENDVEVVEFDSESIDDKPSATNPFTSTSEDLVETATATTSDLQQQVSSVETTNSNIDNITGTNPPPSTSSENDMQALMANASLNLDSTTTTAPVDDDDDIDALLAGATAATTASNMDGLTDADLLNLDIDDAELDDLESFLSK